MIWKNLSIEWWDLSRLRSKGQGLTDEVTGHEKNCNQVVWDKWSFLPHIIFHSHLRNGRWHRHVVYQLNQKQSKVRLAQAKQNLRVTCPKGKLEFKVLPAPLYTFLCVRSSNECQQFYYCKIVWENYLHIHPLDMICFVPTLTAWLTQQSAFLMTCLLY